jgi:hypothetical protein
MASSRRNYNILRLLQRSIYSASRIGWTKRCTPRPVTRRLNASTGKRPPPSGCEEGSPVVSRVAMNHLMMIECIPVAANASFARS